MRITTKHFGSLLLCAILLLSGLSGCGGGGGSENGSGAGGGSENGGGGSNGNTSNPVPTAQADIYGALSWNEARTLDVLGNDTVSDNGTLSLIGVTTPGHGTAQISDNKIIYTPAANFFGQDNFSYTVSGTSGGTTAATDVSVTISAKLTFTGKATDEPLANATVTAKVGNNTYTAVTDVQGNYSVPVVSSTPGDFISITAQGTGVQSHVKLVSLVGDSRTAATAAGVDRTLVADELPGVNVTNVTTALYAQMKRLNNGVVPATQSSLNAAAALVSSQQVLQMAALIKLVADTGTGVSLPSGASDTLALVTSDKTYDQFEQTIAAQQPAKLAATVAAILADPNLSTAPTSTIDTTKSLIYYVGKGCCSFGAMELVLNPDGTAETLEEDGKHLVTWTKANGALTLNYGEPAISTGFNQYEIRLSVTSRQIRQFAGTQDQGVASITSIGTMSYPGRERSPHPITPETGGVATFLFGELSRFNGPTAAELAGNTFSGLTNMTSYRLNQNNQYSLTFAADGTVQSPESPNWNGTWKLEDGKLVITYENGITQTIGRLSAAPDGEERWLIRVKNVYGGYPLGEAMVVKNQNGLAFSESLAANRWVNASYGELVQDGKFLLDLYSNHEGLQESQFVDGRTALGFGMHWEIESGKLVMRNYDYPGGPEVGTCPPDQTCRLVRERTWTLLRSTGTKIFVLEHLQVLTAINQYRINSYEKSGN
jgi:hypothetical protein